MYIKTEIDKIICHIDSVLNNYNLKFSNPCIAISGGADSVFLTYILSRLKSKDDFILLHFDHGWRKKDLILERNLIINYAEKYNFRIIFGSSGNTGSLNEEDARKRRFAFFCNIMDKINSNVLFTGHNLNDRFETFLWNICRGTGIRGILSLKEIRQFGKINIISPLIHLKRDKIRTFCEYLKLDYISDFYNDDIRYKRVFIRKEITPRIENVWQNSLEHFDSFIKLAEDEDCYLEKITNEIYGKVVLSMPWANIILLKELLKFDIALIRRVILKFLHSLDISYNFNEVNLLCKFLQKNENLSLPSFKDFGVYKNKNIFSLYDRSFVKGYPWDKIPKELGISINNPLEEKIFLEIRFFKNSDFVIINGKKIYLNNFFNKKNNFFYKFVPMIFYKNVLKWAPFEYCDENFFKNYNIKIICDDFLEKFRLSWRQRNDRNNN
ncbi:tRNA(Ile)-lysidine synthase [Thermodesulfobium narugense DSM 14796]|uniref:tRNA(Ile)-lysidine synthase n=1 Tax=Thermodesulfobium narugense DSM 14796 TaxID=747365 RepID=M1E8A8_9BACT|nr:tRNA lysidine(34) synthetase TilS [Thermodesulfobium narugense]AEE14364.1 tRNA(Ile)-lysidine synthase [Thermodesulfobium narugense DSM 14796]